MSKDPFRDYEERPEMCSSDSHTYAENGICTNCGAVEDPAFTLERTKLHENYLRLEKLTKEAGSQMLDAKMAFEDLERERNEAWERLQLFTVTKKRIRRP